MKLRQSDIPRELLDVAREALAGGATLPQVVSAIMQAPGVPKQTFVWWLSALKRAIKSMPRRGRPPGLSTAAAQHAKRLGDAARDVARVSRKIRRAAATERATLQEEARTHEILDPESLDAIGTPADTERQRKLMRQYLRAGMSVKTRARIMIRLAQQMEQPAIAARMLERMDAIEGIGPEKGAGELPGFGPLFILPAGSSGPGVQQPAPLPISKAARTDRTDQTDG